LRKTPLAAYVEWLQAVPRAEQFTSAVVIGELYSLKQALAMNICFIFQSKLLDGGFEFWLNR
jgi:hypothetical protein